MTAAPIVAEQIDGTLDPLKLGAEPGEIVVAGRAEAVGHRCAEPGRREGDALAPGEVRPELVPDGGGLRHAVHCHDGHAGSVSAAPDVLSQHNERAG
jgi:hypothetical protein